MKLANLSKILKCAGNDDAITMKVRGLVGPPGTGRATGAGRQGITAGGVSPFPSPPPLLTCNRLSVCAPRAPLSLLQSEDNGDTITFMFESQSERRRRRRRSSKLAPRSPRLPSLRCPPLPRCCLCTAFDSCSTAPSPLL